MAVEVQLLKMALNTLMVMSCCLILYPLKELVDLLLEFLLLDIILHM